MKSGLKSRTKRWLRRLVNAVYCLAILLSMATVSAVAQQAPLNFEAPPISYSDPETDDSLSRLQAEIDSGEMELEFSETSGYLKSVLERLNISDSSQMLNFLKSSLQRPLISPENPRAIYFNDDAYVGYVPGGFIELIVPDAKKGMMFYSLQQDKQKPEFTREVSRCMTCHSSSRTKNIPGLQVRSMFTDPSGQPVLSAGSFRTSHSSPLEERWGGWYVTGQHGESVHRGNFQLPNKKRPKKPIDNTAGQNLTDLSERFEVSNYQTAHSDIVALMVFEHQIDSHNLMVRANYAFQSDFHKNQQDTGEATWKNEADELAMHLLFTDELQLDSPIQGTSSFQQDFQSLGPFDDQQRSLRQFDLKTRLFKFPCSYMVYSKTFEDLPSQVRDYVLGQIRRKLSEFTDATSATSPGKNPTEPPAGLYSAEEIAVAQAAIDRQFQQ